MIEFILKKEINRRVFDEIGASDYFVEAVMLRIDKPVYTVNLETSLYFLMSKSINVPVVARLVIQSPDNLFASSQADFGQLELQELQSFRNNMKITLTNYGAQFIPYTLEFLKITPKN